MVCSGQEISQGSMRIVTSCCVRFALPGPESRILEDSIAPVCAKLSINTMALNTLGKNLCAHGQFSDCNKYQRAQNFSFVQ